MPDELEEVSPDPYRPDATVERADHVVGVLLADHDPVRRYHTVQHLQAGRLRDVQAVTLRELELELGTPAAAAAAVGITRQAAGELLGKAGIPSGKDPLIRDMPAYAYGRYLAVLWAIALSFPQDTAAARRRLDDWDTLQDKATESITLLPKVTETAMVWLKQLRHAHRSTAADVRAEELDELGARISEWARSRHATPRLSIEEQFAAMVGISAAREEYRQQWAQRSGGGRGQDGSAPVS